MAQRTAGGAGAKADGCSTLALTRARDEIHMLYSGYVDTGRGRMHWGRSPFLNELELRMEEAEGE